MAWMRARLSESEAKPYQKVSRDTFLSGPAGKLYKASHVFWHCAGYDRTDSWCFSLTVNAKISCLAARQAAVIKELVTEQIAKQ